MEISYNYDVATGAICGSCGREFGLAKASHGESTVILCEKKACRDKAPRSLLSMERLRKVVGDEYLTHVLTLLSTSDKVSKAEFEDEKEKLAKIILG